MTEAGDARSGILGDIRTALAATGPAPSVPAPPRRRPPGDTVGRFVERVADYRAVVERCRAPELPETVRAAVRRHAGDRTVVVPEGLSVEVPGAVVDAGLVPAELDLVAAVVTDAALGIAESGTIVLDHTAGQGRRALTLVPDVHVCVVRAETIVADVPDALDTLDPSRPLTWISGPSATSDIELDRVEGVHGPRTLHVVVLDVDPGSGSEGLPESSLTIRGR